ncbi:MAG: hypothetical protein HY673_16390 [Chloroflexi bacterium]|nr:hypothetical protein [Chloroflexota bacterium]
MDQEIPLKIAESRAEYGSFKDSLRAPVHRWFMYPAGYSYKLVESKIAQHRLDSNSTVLDPFVGCGTTCIVAKQMGVNSIGIEAHPFVHWVAKVKLRWDYDLRELSAAIDEVVLTASLSPRDGSIERISNGEFPELVTKCFSAGNLARLLVIRRTIEDARLSGDIKDFLKLALTHTLRTASSAGTGWPYIAPGKYHGKTVERDALKEFRNQTKVMFQDIQELRRKAGPTLAREQLILGDARAEHPEIPRGRIDLVVTSPPYLNNYDYADRTRLETYFFGVAHSWREISDSVRARLIMSATTQISRSRYDGNGLLCDDIRAASDRVYGELREKTAALSKLRLEKGGKKSYDILVAGYFNDMFQVLRRVYDALAPGANFILVLGDSAPYGVYIPTDFYIGQLALGIGFKAFQVEQLRRRGEKWAGNPQRHTVPLRESIVTITR